MKNLFIILSFAVLPSLFAQVIMSGDPRFAYQPGAVIPGEQYTNMINGQQCPVGAAPQQAVLSPGTMPQLIQQNYNGIGGAHVIGPNGQLIQ